MYFKRPSFRRGGNIGGGIMSGTNMGTRTGFQNPVIDFLNKNILGTKTQIPTMPTGPVTQSTGIEQILSGTDTRGSVNTAPQTVEELYKRRGDKLKESADFIFSAENTFTDADGNIRNRNTGKLITDTTTSGIAEIVSDGPAGDQITMLSDEAKGAATEALLKSIEEKKKKVEPGSDDSSITLDPYKEIKEEKDFLSKMLKNEGLERGEVALIAARAIGEEGSFKDKLDKAVELALPVVRRRNKEDKALTLTAYKAFKEKEAAQAKAGQDTTGMKDLKSQADLLKESGDPQYKDKSQREIMSILIKNKFPDTNSELRKKNLSDRSIQGEIYERFNSLKGAKTQLDLYIEEKYTKKNKPIDTADKKLLRYQKALEEAKDSYTEFTSIPEFSIILPNLVEAYARLGVKDGGRIERALGSPNTGEQIITTEAQTIGAETAEKPVLKLDYAQLRDRLPPEITDDVVQLLANSEEALQEFAYIQTQNDVDAFNLKYGVNLIIPPAPQTA
jgi:hypothetical protein